MPSGESAWWIASMLAPSTAGVLGGGGLHDREVLGRERHRARVDDLAHAGDEVLAGARHRPADRDDRRVDEADARGEHLADVASGLSHGLDRVEIAALDELDDVVAGCRVDALLAERAAIAGPEARASRHPRLPQWQGTSAPRATCTWPMSPAMPCAPRCRRPPEMTPEPMPVATFTNMRCSTFGQATARSPRAMMFTSLSTSTGTSRCCCTQPGTSKRSQPGMIGGFTGRPVECSTGPGTPMPIAARSCRSRPSFSMQGESCVDHPGEHGLGALRDVHALAALGEHGSGEVGDGEVACEAPRSAASTMRARGVQGELRGRASAGGRGIGDRGDEAEPHELVDARGDGRPGESRDLRERGARARDRRRGAAGTARSHSRCRAPILG